MTHSMYPDQPRTDTVSEAERMLFWELKSQLPDEFVVMHSVRWFTRENLAYVAGKYDKDGEIDFLIAHPRLGLLILEVKGGRITYNSSADQWHSTDRYGNIHVLPKSPFQQAMKSVHALRQKLYESPLTRKYDWPITRAVAFPDFNCTGMNFGIEATPDIIIDAQSIVTGLRKAILRAYGTPPAEHKIPGKDGIAALVLLLAPTVELPRLALGPSMKQDEEKLVSLTQRQFRTLRMLQHLKRVAVAGCAGSGKTMLAMQKVRSLSREGFRTVYTCYNASLARWVSEILVQQEKLPNVTVMHFHQLCQNLCQAAGIAIHDGAALPPDQREAYYEEVLPEKLMQAVKRNPENRFDAIVVDEGQDFSELWWTAIDELVIDALHSPFYIFYDDNQAIYQNTQRSLPANMVPVLLQENCRNTQKIHRFFLPYYKGSSPLVCEGPEGQDVWFEPLSITMDKANAEADALRKTLFDLVQRQAVKPADIVILTYFNRRKSQYTEGRKFASLTLTWDTPTRPNQIRVSTVKSFKGLESSVVILAEISCFAALQEDERDRLFYVASSRAKHQLIVLDEKTKFLSKHMHG